MRERIYVFGGGGGVLALLPRDLHCIYSNHLQWNYNYSVCVYNAPNPSTIIPASATKLSLDLTQPSAGISESSGFCQFRFDHPLACARLIALFAAWKANARESSAMVCHHA